MYGEGNSAKPLTDIISGTTQVTEGISAGMGIDVKALLAGLIGGKLAAPSAPAVSIRLTNRRPISPKTSKFNPMVVRPGQDGPGRF